MKDADVVAVAVLVQDRDAWKALALQAIHVINSIPVEVSAVSMGLGLLEVERYGARKAARSYLEPLLVSCNWNRAEAARMSGVSYKTFLDKMKDAGLTVSDALIDRSQVAGV